MDPPEERYKFYHFLPAKSRVIATGYMLGGVKYHQLVFGKPCRGEGDEQHCIDDTPIRATRFKGVFGNFVKKTKDVLVFEED